LAGFIVQMVCMRHAARGMRGQRVTAHNCPVGLPRPPRQGPEDVKATAGGLCAPISRRATLAYALRGVRISCSSRQ